MVNIKPATLFFFFFFFFFLFVYPRDFAFHLNFTLSLSVSTKEPAGILIGLVLNLQVSLGRIGNLTVLSHPIQRSPTFLAPRTGFVEDSFSMDWRVGYGFGMIQAHYIYCALYFYYYYILIYNEIIIQLTIMQNQWEPWACFPATRWSHLGVMGDSDTWSVLLMSSLFCKMQLNCHLPLADRVLIWFWKQLIYYGLCAVKPLC